MYDLLYEELFPLLQQENWSRFRVSQVIDGLYRSKALEFDQISTLPAEIKEQLKLKYLFFSLHPERTERSSRDETTKFLFRLEDRQHIETVALPNSRGQFTLCVSTQVGCSLKCSFCASGLKGLVRNLAVHEIVEQVMYIIKAGFSVSNIVFMGIGEPLLNYDNVIKAIRIINADHPVNIGARKITLSTAGIIEGIRRFSELELQVRLSVSLHFPDSGMRSKYMPVNASHPLPELISALKEYQEKRGRQITFEYILFKGINDDTDTAAKMIELLRGLDYKVNLIPYNPVEHCGLSAPDEISIDLFYRYLLSRKIFVTLRKRRGDDIKAACGQLRLAAGNKDGETGS